MASEQIPESANSDEELAPSPSLQSVAALLNEVHEVVQSVQRSEEGDALSSDPLQRIGQLEQALYQCQLYIDELKQQLVDQEFLESQLATTEAFSHIQKQAIEMLKTQVAEQQGLQSELEAAQQQIQSMQTQYVEATAIAQQREVEFSTVQLQVLQEQAEIDRLRDKTAQLMAQLDAIQGSMVQETQQRIIAQKTAERLRTELRNRDAVLHSLEGKLQRAEGMLTQREEMINSLNAYHRPDSQKDQCIQGLSATLLKAQRQITELENELSNQSILQAQLQHTTHELAQDTKVTQVRSDQLEKQVNDLQEQVLRQAQQASEYETAVQHWKTRCLEAEEWTGQLSQLWEALKTEGSMPGALPPDLIQTFTELSRWFKGSKGNLAVTDTLAQPSPRELLGLRSQWYQNL